MNTEAVKLLNKESYDINDLIKIMEILRSADGCPWDMEQTHESIRNNLIEETYEAVEAIDNGDRALLREELGDILLQVVFHSRMCQEDGEFDFGDVTDEVCRKLIVRHPHIFSDVNVKDTDEVLKNWEQIKQTTKHRNGLREELDGVCTALPAAMRAQKLQSKAMKADAYQVEGELDDPEAEIGKQLFKLCGLAAKYHVNAEQALYNECVKFVDSFDK